MIKKRFNVYTALTTVLLLLGNGTAKAQSIFEIQRSYELGMSDANDAALQQLQILDGTSSNEEIIKCATPIFAFVHQHEDEISPEILNRFHAAIQPKQRFAETYISNSGKFEIYYETSGPDSVSITDSNGNGVPDYIEWIGEAADSSYRFQVEEVGFKDPIPAGNRYKIFLENMGFYGYTKQVSGVGPRSEIYIVNDFTGFPENTDPEGHQKGAIKATIAHEFKHAIQLEHLGSWPSVGWSEMDATLMEEVVYDEVNDYYNYIKYGLDSVNPTFESLFASPYRGLPGGGYNTVTWMIYFYEVFGINLWKEVWEIMADRSIYDIAEALSHQLPEADYNRHFIKNYLWHFASGERAPAGDYGFSEKEEYPNATMERTRRHIPLDGINVDYLPKLSARYYEFLPDDLDEGVIDLAVDFDTSQIGLGALFYLKEGGVKEFVAHGESKAQVYLPTDLNWEDVERVGIVVANPHPFQSMGHASILFGKNGNRFEIRDPVYLDLPEIAQLNQNYPNPFNLRTTIEFILQRPSHIKLEIFDLLGRKVQTLADETYILGPHEITFDASGLASGVYVYRLQTDDKVMVKKMTLIK